MTLATKSKEKPSGKRPVQTRATPIRIVSASAAGSVLTVEFDQAVIYQALPRWTTNLPATPVSAQLTSPNTIEVTFSASIAAAAGLTIEFQDPGIRNAKGGYIADSTFPV